MRSRSIKTAPRPAPSSVVANITGRKSGFEHQVGEMPFANGAARSLPRAKAAVLFAWKAYLVSAVVRRAALRPGAGERLTDRMKTELTARFRGPFAFERVQLAVGRTRLRHN